MEETRQRNIDAANAAGDLTDELSDLTSQYIELSEAVKTNGDEKENLLSTQNALIDKLGIEKDALQELIKEYGNLDNAMKAAAVESLQGAERDLRGGLNAFGDSVLDTGKAFLLLRSSMNSINVRWDKDNADINHRALDALVDAGYISGILTPRVVQNCSCKTTVIMTFPQSKALSTRMSGLEKCLILLRIRLVQKTRCTTLFSQLTANALTQLKITRTAFPR